MPCPNSSRLWQARRSSTWSSRSLPKESGRDSSIEMPRKLMDLRFLQLPMSRRPFTPLTSMWLSMGFAICSRAVNSLHCPSCSTRRSFFPANQRSLSLMYFWPTL
ncbi:hypothetical protein SETIT_8G128100v2 [Setaria italica]|uniref:Uncharacterized protein n=2 Tax=Setaria TaxID=4554 RepID=A0A368S7A0_SETIT|nr:hypothetical protein SETIT_8G128100v2 [Setaria italica]TKW00785.1 hypothetical protein SEVIR_8G134900v2 [Setaria viridis]